VDKDTSVIPRGMYCYEILEVLPNGGGIKTRTCPYWSFRADMPEQECGYCSYLEHGDWDESIPGIGLLWDKCKECGVNE
jgi:hypothetical protein